MTSLRPPPKAETPSRLVGRVVGLILLVILAGSAIWAVVTNQRIDLTETTTVDELDRTEFMTSEGVGLNVERAGNGEAVVVLLHDVDVAGGVLWDSVVSDLGDEVTTAHGLRVDPQGNLWATDIGSHRVFKFDASGKVLLSLGTGQPGAGPNQFDRPTDVAFGSKGEFYVSDGYGNTRVLKFSPSGALLGAWGTPGTRGGQFNLPHSIVVDRQGVVRWLSVTRNFQVRPDAGDVVRAVRGL